MKAVILAGGFGTRFSEATNLIPKPMIEVGGKPIIWHIMKLYSHYGINEFIICGGYKQHIIKEYFTNYFYYNNDVTVDLSNNVTTIHNSHSENWKVTIIDTGLNTMTGGRVNKIKKYIENQQFCLTYGDGIADLNILQTINLHKESGAILSLTAYKPKGRFGSLEIEVGTNKILSFQEKPEHDENWINAGYFICEPDVFNYIPKGDNIVFEKDPLEKIAHEGKMHAYCHNGFWKPMDTLKDCIELNDIWEQGNAPWKIWQDN